MVMVLRKVVCSTLPSQVFAIFLFYYFFKKIILTNTMEIRTRNLDEQNNVVNRFTIKHQK
jgi:hypothetical protein